MNHSRFRQTMQILSIALIFVMAGVLAVDAQETQKRVVRTLRNVNHAIGEMEDPGREQSHQPEKVLDVLGVVEGQSVADVGAGTGYFSFRAAKKVGVQGRVYAVEIEDKLLEFIRQKAVKLPNLIPIKSSKLSPNLPESSCDKVLIVDTYNYFGDPVSFMKNVKKALKPGGLVAIINRHKFKRAKKASRLAFMSEVIDEMGKAGFVLKESHDFLPERYFLIFQGI